MTDEPGLTPEHESRIRAALAARRVTDGVPDPVAARLDETLARLTKERTGAPAPERAMSERVPESAHRGRWTLVAAAAGIATVAVLSIPALRPDSSGSSSSAAGSADATPTRASTAPASALPRVTGAGFRTDVRRLLDVDQSSLRSSGPSASPSPSGSPQRPGRATRACAPDPAPPGGARQVQVLLDGSPAILEVFAVSNGTRLVRAVSCDGAETLASTRIPAVG